MSLSEAARLAVIIRADPASALAAAVEGWDHPVSREAAILMDLWDLEHAKTGSKKKARYPRPFAVVREILRHGNTAGRTPEQVKAILHGEQFGRSEVPLDGEPLV